jgi:hypothetical protein
MCRHTGVAAGGPQLPRLLTCSRCGDRRLIDTGDCAGRIFSRDAFVDAILSSETPD